MTALDVRAGQGNAEIPGRSGVAPGEFYVLHHMNVDAQGNLYTTEVQDGKRARKFVFKGLMTAPPK